VARASISGLTPFLFRFLIIDLSIYDMTKSTKIIVTIIVFFGSGLLQAYSASPEKQYAGVLSGFFDDNVSSVEIRARSYINLTDTPANEQGLESNYQYECKFSFSANTWQSFRKMIPDLNLLKPSSVPNIFWRVTMKNKSGHELYKYYFGRSYSNTLNTQMLVEGNAYDIPSSFVKILEDAVDMKNCRLKKRGS